MVWLVLLLNIVLALLVLLVTSSEVIFEKLQNPLEYSDHLCSDQESCQKLTNRFEELVNDPAPKTGEHMAKIEDTNPLDLSTRFNRIRFPSEQTTTIVNQTDKLNIKESTTKKAKFKAQRPTHGFERLQQLIEQKFPDLSTAVALDIVPRLIDDVGESTINTLPTMSDFVHQKLVLVSPEQLYVYYMVLIELQRILNSLPTDNSLLGSDASLILTTTKKQNMKMIVVLFKTLYLNDGRQQIRVAKIQKSDLKSLELGYKVVSRLFPFL